MAGSSENLDSGVSRVVSGGRPDERLVTGGTSAPASVTVSATLPHISCTPTNSRPLFDLNVVPPASPEEQLPGWGSFSFYPLPANPLGSGGLRTRSFLDGFENASRGNGPLIPGVTATGMRIRRSTNYNQLRSNSPFRLFEMRGRRFPYVFVQQLLPLINYAAAG